MDQPPGKVGRRLSIVLVISLRGKINTSSKNPCPRSRLRIWSRETGSAVPSRLSLLILHTQAESGTHSSTYISSSSVKYHGAPCSCLKTNNDEALIFICTKVKSCLKTNDEALIFICTSQVKSNNLSHSLMFYSILIQYYSNLELAVHSPQ